MVSSSFQDQSRVPKELRTAEPLVSKFVIINLYEDGNLGR